jgi:4-hydroxythreonine-4-phosphate dehydrogenase
MKPNSGPDEFETKPSSRPGSDPGSGLLVVTAGEPAGIGPEICLALADTVYAERIAIIADPDMLSARAEQVGSRARLVDYRAGSKPAPGQLQIIPEPLAEPAVAGRLNEANAESLLRGLRKAVAGCQSGEFTAMVTAPLQKSVINDAGIPFSGHTEFIAALTGCDRPVMLLTAGSLRVALASTHLPLRDVPDYLSSELILEVLTILDGDLRARFRIDTPRIIVCGLNPHAGEGGHLGKEDEVVIAPAVAAAVDRGINATGPLPADTAFTPAAGGADAILAMYHDQGLPVLKYAGFGNAVNVTLGLPIVRTSVDHGTALDIAGTGRADPGSLIAAVQLATQLSA